MGYRRGWYKESQRHSLAARGVSTSKYLARKNLAAKTGLGRALERVQRGGDVERQRAFILGDLPERQKLSLQLSQISGPLTPEEELRRQKMVSDVEADVASRGGGRRFKTGPVRENSTDAFLRGWKKDHTNRVIEIRNKARDETRVDLDKLRKQTVEVGSQEESEVNSRINLLVTREADQTKVIDELNALLVKAEVGAPLTSAQKKVLGEHVKSAEMVDK